MRLLALCLAVFGLWLPLHLAWGQLGQHPCEACHSTHGGHAFLLDESNADTLCMTCHGPGGASSLAAEPHMGFGCNHCHLPHGGDQNWLGGTNIKSVRAQVMTPSMGLREVVFESRGTDEGQPSLHSFADLDEDGNGLHDGICQVCHTTTKYFHWDGGGADHRKAGRTCTRCHDHNRGFLR